MHLIYKTNFYTYMYPLQNDLKFHKILFKSIWNFYTLFLILAFESLTLFWKLEMWTQIVKWTAFCFINVSYFQHEFQIGGRSVVTNQGIYQNHFWIDIWWKFNTIYLITWAFFLNEQSRYSINATFGDFLK